jgi:hypothetical protein
MSGEMVEGEIQIIRIEPLSAPKWPIEARTLSEAMLMLQQSPRWWTREELEALFPPAP